MKYYVAIDLGATSGRVALAAIGSGAIELETIHRFSTPIVERDGGYYWDIRSIFDSIVKGLVMVAGKGLKIESIGIDTWGVDFAVINKDGKVSMPRAYRDPYTNDIPEQFFKKMPADELYRRTGIQIMHINSVFQLYAQAHDGSGIFDKATKVLFMPDALNYMLTGRMACEYTILSTSALMNPRTKTIDRDILEVCNVDPSLFAEIVMPGTVLGTLTDDIASETGLGKVPVIAVAGHDTGSAVAAVPASDGNFAYLSSGTWSLMGIETASPVINEHMFKLNFTNEGGVGGTTRLLKNITGMWILEQCIAKWKEEGKYYSYKELADMASGGEASADIIDIDDNCFASPTDMPKAIINYCNQNNIKAPGDDAAMTRLIYDSMAGKYASVFRDLQSIAPFSIDALHIIGGGCQNELLNRMTAEACGVKVIAGPSEATALGNIMVQAGLKRDELNKFIETRIY